MTIEFRKVPSTVKFQEIPAGAVFRFPGSKHYYLRTPMGAVDLDEDAVYYAANGFNLFTGNYELVNATLEIEE